MEEILIKDKQQYLNDHYPLGDTLKLVEKKRCIHCDTIFTVGDYKVQKTKKINEFIRCSNAPDCDGTVIDQFRVD